MADAIYHFVWGTFCDWYVELVKGAFDDETKAVAAWAFDQILVMLHPLMPFITEELWNAMGERPYELIVAKWPEPEAQADPHAKAEIEWLIRVGQRGPLGANGAECAPRRTLCRSRSPTENGTTAGRLDKYQDSLAKLAAHRAQSPRSAETAQIVVGEATYVLALAECHRYRGRKGPPVERRRRRREGTRRPRRASGQSELHRTRQARGGREGPRRP